jgi:hypothetical protein
MSKKYSEGAARRFARVESISYLDDDSTILAAHLVQNVAAAASEDENGNSERDKVEAYQVLEDEFSEPISRTEKRRR